VLLEDDLREQLEALVPNGQIKEIKILFGAVTVDFTEIKQPSEENLGQIGKKVVVFTEADSADYTKD
jgi:hypothetical protein